MAHPYNLQFVNSFNPKIESKMERIKTYSKNKAEELQKARTEKYLVYLKEKANKYGLDLGCEIVFKHKNYDGKFFNNVCNKYNIIPSAGSDFHGYHKNISKTLGTHESKIAFKNIPLLNYLKHRDLSKLNFQNNSLTNYFEEYNCINIGKYNNVNLTEQLKNSNKVLKEIFVLSENLKIQENLKAYNHNAVLEIKKKTDMIENRIMIKKRLEKFIKEYEEAKCYYDTIKNDNNITQFDVRKFSNYKNNINKILTEYFDFTKTLSLDTLENNQIFKEKIIKAFNQ